MNSDNKLHSSDAKLPRAMLMLLGFSVPISTALDNLMLLLLLIFGLLICRRDELMASYRNPVALAATLLFLILFVAIFYGSTPFGDAVGTLGKYVDLAMIPLFMAVMRKDQNRDSALHGFMLAMLVTLMLSYLVGFGVLKVQPWMWEQSSVNSPAIFRHQLPQNTFMALAAFLALMQMRETVVYLRRAFWMAFALLAIYNVLFMVQGRTGYLTLIILLGWFAWSTLARHLSARGRPIGWRHATAVTVVIVLLASGVYSVSSRLQGRINLAISDLTAWKPGVRSDTSVGDRMEFYYNALQISRLHPVVGVGTGGFRSAYERQVQGKDLWVVSNPHNGYLLIFVETGLIGLTLMLYLFYTLWRYAPLLDSAFKQDAARGMVLATLADSLFNSPLLDHAPGLLFALMTAIFFANLETNKKLI